MKWILKEFNNPPMKAWAISMILALAIAAAQSTSFHLDDHSAERATADTMNDAIKAAQKRDRFIKAASDICGINAGFIEQADGSIRCTLHTGRKTSRTAMVNQ
jgi:hypothetical protein